MDCKEALELITPAVDESLTQDLRARFDAHLKQCSHCRGEFQLELTTKQFIRSRVIRLSTPDYVAAQIISDISRLAHGTQRRWFSLGDMFARPAKKSFIAGTAITFAIVLFLLIPLQTQHSHARPEDSDIVDQTYNNFGKVIKGSFVPGVESDDNKVVENYFATKANFKVHVPKLKQCKLVSGSLSHYKEERIAHLVYQQKKNFIYIYQTGLRAVMYGNSLQLTDKAKNELQHQSWYIEKQCPECTLMLWTVDSMLCCAVANMDQPQLLAYLKESE